MNSGPTASTIVFRKYPVDFSPWRMSRCANRPGPQSERAGPVSARPQRAIIEACSVNNPPQGEMDDAPSVICLRETIEPFDWPADIARTEELGT